MTDPQHNYQRPQQKWVCGRNCSTPCAQGPTKSGRCKTTSDCTPTKRDERWRCTRSALQGGPCETGPSPEGVCCQVHPPCVPRRSQRSQRGIAAGISLAFTVGLLFVLLGLPNWRTHVAPGPLASSHAQLFQSESESQKCTACHYEFNFQTGEWLTAFWVSNQDSTHSMSQRCMNCHQQNFSDTWAKAPHTLPSELTEKLTAELLASASSNTGDSNLIELAHFIPKTTAKLECARCHQEHQGTGHDLTTLTDKQCQSCHAQQFESFSHGHPEFIGWPLQRASAIQFNHVTHAGKHFVDRKQNFDCNRCHTDPQTNSIVSVVNFEQSCADCHQEQLNQSIADGIPLLALPMIDQRALATRLESEFPWPDAATGDFDGRVPVLMQFLLSSSNNTALSELFGEDVDFSFVDPEKSQDLDVVSGILPEIRQLWYELASDGQTAFSQRIEVITGNFLSEQQRRGLSSLLPLDLFRISYADWFQIAPNPRSTERLPGRTIQLLAGNAEPLPRMYVAEEMIVLPGDELLLDSLPPGEWVGTDEPSTSEQKEPVVEKTEPEVTTQKDPVAPIEKTEEAKEPSQPVVIKKTTPSPSKSATPDPKPVNKIQKPVKDIVSQIEWREIPQRGWYRDDLTLTIGYRPVGHADLFMSSWLELAFSTGDGEVPPAVLKLRKQLAESPAFKNCLSCHQLDQTLLHSGESKWLSNSKQFRPKSFTRFSHQPHLTIPEMRDCKQCHTLQAGQTDGKSHEFSRLSIQSCIRCHNAEGASQSCAECHNYHIDHRSLISVDAQQKRREE